MVEPVRPIRRPPKVLGAVSVVIIPAPNGKMQLIVEEAPGQDPRQSLDMLLTAAKVVMGKLEPTQQSQIELPDGSKMNLPKIPKNELAESNLAGLPPAPKSNGDHVVE